MPYRRLPNTDSARIRSLKAAISKMQRYDSYNREIINLDVQKLEIMLRDFESAQVLYKESLNRQATENRNFQKLVKNARLYISHFIQVLNLSVIRNEIRTDAKRFYNLDVDNFAVPDLATNDAILTWGENVINGENKRLQQGGAPIYNPTIARVNVACSLFKDAFFTQKTHQNTTNRQLGMLSDQRADIDETLCILWNQIEEAFDSLAPAEKLERCKEFGIVYYFRKGEHERLTQNNNHT